MNHSFVIFALALVLSTGAVARSHHKSKPATPPPAFSAKSFLVADSDGQILREQNGDIVRPIASISKLMIAVLATEQDLEESLSIPSTRQVQSNIPRKVTSLTRRELLTLSLVHSDNFATQILCANLEECVIKMNERAQILGMTDTHYEEPTGLDKGNVSTAHDLLKLIMSASLIPTITEISSMPKAEIPLVGKSIKVNNTNPLTSKFDIVLSKTGFTGPAGGCLVMMMNANVGQRILILLGSKNGKTRIPDMERLVKEL